MPDEKETTVNYDPSDAVEGLLKDLLQVQNLSQINPRRIQEWQAIARASLGVHDTDDVQELANP